MYYSPGVIGSGFNHQTKKMTCLSMCIIGAVQTVLVNSFNKIAKGRQGGQIGQTQYMTYRMSDKAVYQCLPHYEMSHIFK